MASVYELSQKKSKLLSTYNPEIAANKNNPKVIWIKPGEKKVVLCYSGCGLISRLWCTFSGWFWEHWSPDSTVDPRVLKSTIIRIFWDDSQFPSVESPMADFFGIGHCEVPHFTSKYLGMSSGGFYSYIPMPFQKGFRIEVENGSEAISIPVFMQANITAVNFENKSVGYLHCQFVSGLNNGNEPLRLLQVEGKGKYFGTCLSIQGKRPARLFYLEAPERIYVDDSADAQIGTGMEDFFNSAWYFREGAFFSRLHGAPIKDAINSMVSMYRFREEDAVDFEKSFILEFFNPMTNLELDEFWFSSTNYYYMDRPQRLTWRLPENLMSFYRLRDRDHIAVP